MKKKFSIKQLLTSLFAGVCLVCSGGAIAMLKDSPEAAAEEGKKVELYQLAPNKENLLESYVIKTANGKLIVIDGGMGTVYDADYAAVKNSQAYLPSALRAIAGKGDNEEVEVEAWFLSHAHRDHFAELTKIMSAENAHGLTINNFYFDFPDFGGEFPLVNSQQADLDELKAAFNTYAATKGIETSNYYEDLNGAVVNAENVEKGLSITVDGVRFEILQTWDIADGKYEDINDTSMVIRMVTGDNSVLFLNDLGIEGGDRLTKTYTTEELTSDYVQMSHHGHGGVTKAQYAAMGVTTDTYQLWPTPSVTFFNPSDFFVNETYEWFNTNSLMTDDPAPNNFFACLYEYPTDIASVESWASVVDGMKVASFDYEELGFEMIGASVRTADPDGIRFIAQVADEAVAKYGEGAKYGVIVVPADLDTPADLTVEYDGSTYTISNEKAMVIEAGQWWSDELEAIYGVKDGYAAYSGALLAAQNAEGEVVNFPASFYNRPMTAVGFIIPEEGETVYTEKVTRSIAYVASVEKMKENYEEVAAIERIAAGAALKVSVNDGKKLENLYKTYEPTFTIGGMDAATSALVNVTYTSSAPEIAKI
ncbi:MAG: MBL fold metallo-hydrolase, partial [Clostridia bacterium]|nr:MBL fold metallo-hydrolase [Clostridia bacterium]